MKFFYVEVGQPNTPTSWLKVVHKANDLAEEEGGEALFGRPLSHVERESTKGSETFEEYAEANIIVPVSVKLPVQFIAKTERAAKLLTSAVDQHEGAVYKGGN